jgi:YidC/Oxa1 family membrane protein insertase
VATTPFAEIDRREDADRVTALRHRLSRVRPILVLLSLAILAVALVACVGPAASPGASGAPPPSPSAQPPLQPASPGADPFSLFAFIFTPIFQVMFIVLVGIYVVLYGLGVPGAIGIAIVILTILVRALLIPLFRRQLVSQRRMQMLQPEIAEIRRRFKGDRMKQQAAQAQLFKERNVSYASGCLPLLLQMPLLFIIYSVISSGLTNYDPTAMLSIGGAQIVPLECPSAPVFDPPGSSHVKPCVDTFVPWLGNLDVSVPEVFIGSPGGFLSGLGWLAIVSAVLQLIQSRMMLSPADPTNDDPTTRATRQTMYFLPAISLLYASIFPAGLFIYWIVTTIFSIVQQYLIVGWGAMFPFLGWHPGFARDHAPRFPVTMPPVDPTKRSPSATSADEITRETSANRTIRPNKQRGRQGRRGRRR